MLIFNPAGSFPTFPISASVSKEKALSGCLADAQDQAGSLGILAGGRKFAELWGYLTCLYSGVGQSTHAISHMSHLGKSQLP